MMKIIFITRSWHGTGGMQRFSRDFAECVTNEFGDQAAVLHPSSRGVGSLMMFAIRAFFTGLRYGRGAQIHLGDASLIGLGLLLKKATRARLSVTVHGLDVLYPKAWYQWMIRHGLPSADRVCAVSQATADSAKRRGVPNDRIVVIANGIHAPDDEAVRMAHERGPMFITVGRLIPRKGVSWFIDAVLPLLLKDFPALQYHVVGDGPEFSAIQSAVDRRMLREHAFLHSSRTDDERDALLLQSDLFVMPNVVIDGDMEGFGIVCIEATKLGVPIAAAKLQGITDAVQEGKTGMFFEPGNAADCVRVITHLLHHPMQPSDVRSSTLAAYDWRQLFRLYRDKVFAPVSS